MRRPNFKILWLAPLMGLGIATAAAADGTVEGDAIYQQRCAACHDHPREQIPPKTVLSSKPKPRIIQALTNGIMQPMAAGLTPSQIDTLAAYLVETSSTHAAGIEGPPASANLCQGSPSPAEPAKGDWNGWSPDLENTRFQPNPDLSAAHVARLKPKWVFAYPGIAGAMGPPSVVGSRVYLGTDTGSVLSPRS